MSNHNEVAAAAATHQMTASDRAANGSDLFIDNVRVGSVSTDIDDEGATVLVATIYRAPVGGVKRRALRIECASVAEAVAMVANGGR